MKGQALQRIWIIGMILAFLIWIPAVAATLPAKNLEPGNWLKRIAPANPLFGEWKKAQVRLLFAEPDDQDDPVHLWAVSDGGKNLGYLVTSHDGQTLLEYSPITPVSMQVDRKKGTYLYAGPGMHLYKAAGQQQWVNLSNGETLPNGNPVRHTVSDQRTEAGQRITSDKNSSSLDIQSNRMMDKSFPTDIRSDRGIAAMIQYSLGQTVPFELNRLPKTGESAGYLVYRVLPKDYYSVWAITGMQTIPGQPPYLEVNDVFANDPLPLYIRGDMPVNWVGSK